MPCSFCVPRYPQASLEELAKAQKFREIACNVQIRGWLHSQTHPLHVLLKYQPPVAVVRAVMDHLERPALLRDDAYQSPLHVAVCQQCDLSIIDELLGGAVLSDVEGRYALHAVCAMKDPSVDVVQRLVRANPIVVLTKDHSGQTPFDLAIRTGADTKVTQTLGGVFQQLRDTTKKHHSGSTVQTANSSFCSSIVPMVVRNYDEDDLSSVGSYGVSQHVRRSYYCPDEPVELLDI